MSEINFANNACIPCSQSGIKAGPEEIAKWIISVPGWFVNNLSGIDMLIKEFKFKNFRTAIAFTNRVGDLAEDQKHHPEIRTEWGKVTVIWWTHGVSGLHKNDFIMAAKTDNLYNIA